MSRSKESDQLVICQSVLVYPMSLSASQTAALVNLVDFCLDLAHTILTSTTALVESHGFSDFVLF